MFLLWYIFETGVLIEEEKQLVLPLKDVKKILYGISIFVIIYFLIKIYVQIIMCEDDYIINVFNKKDNIINVHYIVLNYYSKKCSLL